MALRQQLKKKKMQKFISSLEKNFLIFFTYSILGWIYEVLWFLIVRHQFVNRGFLFGPYLPIYGFGSLILYYLLKNFMKKKHKVKNVNLNVVYIFLIIFVVTTIVEYIAHYLLDTYFHIILWDYSKDYLNINGRVCFAASRNFAILGTIFLYFLQPSFEKLINKYDGIFAYHLFCFSTFVIIFFDFLLKIT